MSGVAQRASFLAIVAWVAVWLGSAADVRGAVDAGDRAGTWQVRYVSRSTLDLELGYRHDGSTWMNGETMTPASAGLRGLTTDEIRTANGDKTFLLDRDAGTFTCRGSFLDGFGSGVYAFAPNPAYADGLASRGLGRPDDDQQFRLAFANVSLQSVDRLAAAHVTGLSISGLIQLADHGVGADYAAAMASAGIHVASVDQLTELRDHGVDSDFASALAQRGYRLGVEDLVRLRDHGVQLDFVNQMAKLGYHPSADDLVRLRDHGVDAAYVAGLAKYGYHPSADEVIRLRDHGVTLDYVARLVSHGYHPSIDDLIRLRDSGVS